MVSQELLAELKVIMKEDFGIELQQEALTEFGNMLIAFFELLQEKGGRNAKR